jgi:hypothetical protein
MLQHIIVLQDIAITYKTYNHTGLNELRNCISSHTATQYSEQVIKTTVLRNVINVYGRLAAKNI